MDKNLIEVVRVKAAERVLFLPHAMSQMTRLDRMISTSDVREVVFGGEIVEDYPEDTRGRSCLILGYGNEGRSIHVVCSPKDHYLAIITAYIPGEDQWLSDCKTRRKK